MELQSLGHPATGHRSRQTAPGGLKMEFQVRISRMRPFSELHSQCWQMVSSAPQMTQPDAVKAAALAVPGDPALIRLCTSQELGSGGTVDQLLTRRSREERQRWYSNLLYMVVPVYVSSICSEHCLYCNYRAENRHESIARLRLDHDALQREVEFLVGEKGYRCIELVSASDPRIIPDVLAAQVTQVRRILDQVGGGVVGLSAEPFSEDEYRRLAGAGLHFSVLWMETYDPVRYAELHPGRGRKPQMQSRLDAYERMLRGGIPEVGVGILSGLSDWRLDWQMLLWHQLWLKNELGLQATIVGTPRLKDAPGAAYSQAGFIPSDGQFAALLSLQQLMFPDAKLFLSTRETYDFNLDVAKGGGCLFTLNCSTIPGGYTSEKNALQFASGNYDSHEYAARLQSSGFQLNWDWKISEAAAAAELQHR